jgi:hypothetical protein
VNNSKKLPKTRIFKVKKALKWQKERVNNFLFSPPNKEKPLNKVAFLLYIVVFTQHNVCFLGLFLCVGTKWVRKVFYALFLRILLKLLIITPRRKKGTRFYPVPFPLIRNPIAIRYLS